MESKFIPVRGNPSSPTKNTDYPFGWSVFFMSSPGGNGRAVRCLLLKEKVLSAARRMRWRGHDRLQCRRQCLQIQQHLIRRGVPPRRLPLKGKACKPLSGSTAAQTLLEKPSIRPLTPPVRPAARPAPGGTDRSRACQNSRHIPSARRARTATDTPRPTTAAAQNTPRIAASAFPLSFVKLLCIWITFDLSLYSLE